MATHAIVSTIVAVLAGLFSGQDKQHALYWPLVARPIVLWCPLDSHRRSEPEGGAYELIRAHWKRRRGLKTLSSSQSCLLVEVSSAFRASVPKTESQAPPWNVYTFLHHRRGLSTHKRIVDVSMILSPSNHSEVPGVLIDDGSIFNLAILQQLTGLEAESAKKWAHRHGLVCIKGRTWIFTGRLTRAAIEKEIENGGNINEA